MPRTFGRKLLWAYALLLLLVAYGYARFDLYMMDGDGTAFMDIAQDLNTHHAALAINGYWNPSYPAVLAVAEKIAHPTLWRELAVVRYANVLIFAVAMLACLFFTTGLARARQVSRGAELAAMPAPVLHLLGLALLTLSLGRELPVAAPRADTLLFALLMFAAGLLLRFLVGEKQMWVLPALGVSLGLAYLTKSFAFLPSVALIVGLVGYSLLQPSGQRVRALAATAACGVLFGVIAGPYILAISRQLGHFSTGESARLNYAFFIDMTPRWHEWFHHDLGHAGGTFVHPEAVLATATPTFSYAAHPYGTFPLWFDPAWWTLGLKPHVWMKGHVLRLARNVVVFFRYLLGRPEIFVLFAVLLGYGFALRRPHSNEQAERGWLRRWPWRQELWAIAPVTWGLLMLFIYLPIDLQDRYFTAPLFLIVLPLFAALRVRRDADVSGTSNANLAPAAMQTVAGALVVLFAGIALTQSLTYLAERRRHIPPAEQRHPGFDAQVFTAAAALDRLGLRPGDKVACMGDLACYTDFYWARLAGTQILGEVETPGEANPITVWNDLPDKHAVTDPLARMGLRYIVSLFPNSASKPAGWVQLGESNFFAYPLQQTLSPEQAKAISAFKPAP